MDNKTGPEIGTTAAAVESCVSVLSAVTGQREETMERWLDLYYQVRRAHERAKEAIEAEAYLIEGLSLEPSVLMSAVPDDRGERRAADNAALSEGVGLTKPQEPEPLRAKETKPKPTGGAGKPRPSQVGNTHNADAAAYKREVRNRLLDLRKNGVSAAQIAEAGRGTGYTEGDVYSILEGKKIGVTVYRAIDAALGKLAGCIGQEDETE
jgi:hypothetical protein